MKYKPGAVVRIVSAGKYTWDIGGMEGHRYSEVYGVAQRDGYLFLYSMKTGKQLTLSDGDYRTTWSMGSCQTIPYRREA